MWPNRKVFYSLILIILFSACQSGQIEAIPADSPNIIKIGLQPTLAYLKEPLSVCANQDPSYDLLLLEKNSYDWMIEPVDVIFTSQHAVDGSNNTYYIDEINIVIIANPDFPISQLDTSQLQAIFNSEMVSPAHIGLSEETTITIYGFETNSDMAGLFKYQYGFSPELPVDAFLAASPQAVVNKIADQPMSIGYTLSPVVTDHVKILNSSTENNASPIPVIASFKSDLTPTQETLISCLQTSLTN